MADDLKQTGKPYDQRFEAVAKAGPVVKKREARAAPIDAGGTVRKRITDSFVRGSDGRWTCIEAVTLHYPSKPIQFKPGTTWGPEDSYMGVKVAKLLDSFVDARRAGRSSL